MFMLPRHSPRDLPFAANHSALANMYNIGVNAQKPGLIWIALGLVYLFFLNKPGTSTALPDPSNG